MAKGKSYTNPTAKKSQTKENKANFLKALQDNYANISKACEAIGISRFTYYKWFFNGCYWIFFNRYPKPK